MSPSSFFARRFAGLEAEASSVKNFFVNFFAFCRILYEILLPGAEEGIEMPALSRRADF